MQHFNILTEDNTGNIWYFTGEEAGVLRVQEDGSYVNISLPFKQIQGSFIGGFEYINPVDEEHVFFGAKMDLSIIIQANLKIIKNRLKLILIR